MAGLGVAAVLAARVLRNRNADSAALEDTDGSPSRRSSMQEHTMDPPGSLDSRSFSHTRAPFFDNSETHARDAAQGLGAGGSARGPGRVLPSDPMVLGRNGTGVVSAGAIVYLVVASALALLPVSTWRASLETRLGVPVSAQLAARFMDVRVQCMVLDLV